MKSKCLILSLLPLLLACNAMNNGSRPFVIDNAHLLLPPQAAHLDSLYARHKAHTGNIIRLVTIYDIDSVKDLHTYAKHYFDTNELNKEGSGSLMLILFCTSCHAIQILSEKSDKRILTDVIMDSVMNKIMVPQFNISADYQGLLDGSNTIIAILEKQRK